MKCDLHVHTVHSGMCTVPLLRFVCRESYSEPGAVYERLKRLGMDLVTITDHDSIDAAESLRSYPDFFLSEEVTCTLPTGTKIHLGVFDIDEAQHLEVQRRRNDFESLSAYLREQDLLFSINHAFSRLTGRRLLADFAIFAEVFPAFETLNGHMLAQANRSAAEMAERLGKAPVAGSDAHTVGSAGLAYTEVQGARSKAEYMGALRRGLGVARGESGSFLKLTRDVLSISAAMVRQKPAAAVLAPLALLVPAVTFGNFLLEASFASRWMDRLDRAEGAIARRGAETMVAA
jgi:predicted metal-dependent phosphoesterase TrpH